MSAPYKRKEVIGDATLYLGDCLEILPTLPKVDAVITDPPYGFGHYRTDDDIYVVGLLHGFSRKAVFGYPEILCGWCALWGMPDEWVTWWPTNKPGGQSVGLSRESECIAFYGPLYKLPVRPRASDSMTLKIHSRRGNNLIVCKEGDVWRDPSPGCGFNGHLRNHPNEKPISVMNKIIAMSSQTEEIVFDPFMGSGSTGVACVNIGRKFIGIEIEPKYFDIAFERVKNAQRQERLFS